MYYVFGGGITGRGIIKYLLHSRGLGLNPDSITLIDSAAPSNQDPNTISNVKVVSSVKHDTLQKDDVFIPSPGISPEHDVFKEFAKAQIKPASDVELALSKYKGNIIAITGTNGKSTVTSMISYLMNAVGESTEACGNIGVPPSEVAISEHPPQNIALELSSYQLEYIAELNSIVNIFTNIEPDHLERHGSVENYFHAKWRLIKASPHSNLITSQSVIDFATGLGLSIPDNTKVLKNINPIDFTHISTGNHNQINAAMAIEAAKMLCSTEEKTLRDHIKEFPGLKHRCEIVANTGPMTIVNDSKSTNVASTLTALEAFASPVILMLGGVRKKETLEPLKSYKNIVHIYFFGQDGKAMQEELTPAFSTTYSATLEEATKFAFKHSKETASILLFSPACASFDEFKNFEKRGEQFKDLINKLLT